MANTDYKNFGRRGPEDDAIVANTQPRISLPLASERLDIAFTYLGEPGECVQDTKSGLPIDRSQF